METMFSTVVALVLVEGGIQESERLYLETLAARWKLTNDDAARLIKEAHLRGARTTVPRDPILGRKLLGALVEAALADGAVAPKERLFVARIAAAMNVEPATLEATFAEATKSAGNHQRFGSRTTRNPPPS